MQAGLREAGIAFAINPRLVRGLDYYNLTVFEWVAGRLGAQNAICAGGRYDGLFEQLGGKPTPCCGFAIGVERVAAAAGERDVARGRTRCLPRAAGRGRRAGLPRARQNDLRDAGLSVVLHCGGGSFKSQMKRADASGARYAVIIGDDEAAHGDRQRETAARGCTAGPRHGG